MGKRILSMMMALIMIVSISPIMKQEVQADEEILPTASDNLSISLRKKSEIVATDTGYMRVFYDGEKIGIEYYDDQFNIVKKQSIAMELALWGGFYAGENAYYLVEGQYNMEENDTAEVIRVIKYDKNWNKKGAASITGNTELFGGDVRIPFNVGCVEMTEKDGVLYVVTGHEGYVDDKIGQGHQGFLMLAVDQSTMTGEIIDCDLWHSFAQYIDQDEDYLYVLEQSEGSRYTSLSRSDKNNRRALDIPVLEYGGSHTSVWSIPCYASVDGMAVSEKNILCLGTSIDQSKYDDVSSDMPHNIYLTVTPKNDFSQEATTVKWLTDFSSDGKCFLGVSITKVNEDRFMLAWEVANEEGTADVDDTLSGNTLHYVFIDGDGTVISDEYTARTAISDCQPIVKDSKIVYYASSSVMINFYTIDANTGEFDKKCYRVAGENATWNVQDGVLTLTGTGAVTVDTESNYRYPLSSTARSYSYSIFENGWKPIRDNVEKIVIDKGMDSVSKGVFQGFSKVREVIIADGMKSIGAEAFAYCNNLKKITIPKTVTEMGEKALWSGYYWAGNDVPAYFTTIYTHQNPYIVEYAEANGISYVIEHVLDDGRITKEPSCKEKGEKTFTCTICGDTEKEEIATVEHIWESEYTIDQEPTDSEYGIKSIHCKNCDARTNIRWFANIQTPSGSETENQESDSTWIPDITEDEKELVESLGLSPSGAKEIVGYAQEKGINTDLLLVTESTIKKQKSEDVKNATYNVLTARATKATKNSITLKWNKVKGADGYTVYGNKCGTSNKYKKLKDIKKTTYTQKKLKKGTFYKYLVVAYKLVDGKKVTIAASKTIHEITSGGKYGNAKSVKLKNVKKNKVSVKKGKSFTIKATEVKKDKKLKKHRALSYESSDTKIATVNKKGKITGKKKGTCYVYVYAQNGLFQKIKVIVK